MTTPLWRMHTPELPPAESTNRPYTYQPDELWELCCKYFEWLQANPIQEEKVFQYQGEIIRGDEAKMRPPTQRGLCAFLGVTARTWQMWRESTQPGIREVVERVEDIMYDWKLTGAAAGVLNATIITRDLGLREGMDHSSADGSMTPMQVPDKLVEKLVEKLTD